MTRWVGNISLKRRLIPVDNLRTHPRNARRGDLAQIAKSLERFGQQRAALALPDGTIVAGNHTFMAARDILGWDKFAVETSDLQDAEVEAYLVADNRTSDLGTYDLPMLASLIAPFANNLDGLGFTPKDYEDLVKSAAGVPEPNAAVSPPPGEAVKTLFLSFPAADFEHVTMWLGMVAKERDLDIPTTVLQLAREAAEGL